VTADDRRDYYTSEGCAALARVLCHELGWTLAILWDDAAIDDWGRRDEPTPAHVFVRDPATGEALDAYGRRSVAAIRAHFDDLEEPVVRDATVAELDWLCGDYRPFYAVEPRDLADAYAASVALGLFDEV
jgi:hypothetical protein